MTYAAYKCDLRRMQPSVWDTASVNSAGVNSLQKMAVVQLPGCRLPLNIKEEEEERGAKFCTCPSWTERERKYSNESWI